MATEEAFALELWLSDLGAYAALLIVLRSFYLPMEVALGALDGWGGLTPGIDVGARRRARLIDLDLAHLVRDHRELGTRLGAQPVEGLGVQLVERRAERSPELPACASLASGLGCLYVLEGSALGGAIVARRARARLGGELPVAFFSSAGRADLRGDWRSLQDALNGFGSRQGWAASEAVVAASLETFSRLRALLDLQVVPR